MFLSRLLIASAVKGSFLHLCLGFNSIRFSPAPFILIGKFQNTDTGLPLLLHQAQLWNSKRNSRRGWEQSPGGLWSGCGAQTVMCQEGIHRNLSHGMRGPSPSDAFLPYRTASFLLVASPSQPEFPPGPLPWTSHDQGRKGILALLQGTLASNLRAWKQ